MGSSPYANLVSEESAAKNIISDGKCKKVLIIENMRNIDLGEKHLQISDPIENYFECITTCDVNDGTCISRCVEILKQYDNSAI